MYIRPRYLRQNPYPCFSISFHTKSRKRILVWNQCYAYFEESSPKEHTICQFLSVERKYLAKLLKLLKKRSASLVVLKGRCRIGKSRLAEEFSKHFPKVYTFSGLVPDEKVIALYEVVYTCLFLAMLDLRVI